jgi:Cof subfamily protein (haloacid dehalogenase superfamily)
MKYENTAILTDLDGTLFNSQGLVSDEDRTAIAEYIAQGGLFGVATGREPHNARLHLPELPMNAPSIVLNGAAVYDFLAERYLNTVLMDKEAALQVLEHCGKLQLPLDVQIYTTEGIFYATPLETADPGFLRIHQPTSFQPMEVLVRKDWMKVVLLEREKDALQSMVTFLQTSGLDRRISLVEGTTDVVKIGKYQELLAADINKGVGISLLHNLPVYEGRELFAVGDYWNDYELLEAADHACAPANAIEEIKAISSVLLPSHNDSAIARLIRNVIPKMGEPSA